MKQHEYQYPLIMITNIGSAHNGRLCCQARATQLGALAVVTTIFVIYRDVNLLDQALAEPGGAEGKRVVSIHKNVVTHQFEL